MDFKKIFLLFLSMCLIFSFSACGKKTKDTDKDVSSGNSTGGSSSVEDAINADINEKDVPVLDFEGNGESSADVSDSSSTNQTSSSVSSTSSNAVDNSEGVDYILDYDVQNSDSGTDNNKKDDSASSSKSSSAVSSQDTMSGWSPLS